eukprot:scaffold18612_cov118-Isochrysis_galbana.AAC.6
MRLRSVLAAGAPCHEAPVHLPSLRGAHPLWLVAQVKPFIKCCNYTHLMPTRYTLDVDFKSVVTADIVGSTNPTARQSCRKEVRLLTLPVAR